MEPQFTKQHHSSRNTNPSRSFTRPNAFKPEFWQSPSSNRGGTTFTSPVPQGHAGTQAGFRGAWSLEFPLAGR